jgi:hypothetical protein
MTERHKALEALGQVSILELIHSAASCFNTLCFNLMMLFLDPTISIHEKAMIFMYNILQEIEEPYQFAVIYSSLIDFIVQNASSISTTSTSTSKKKPNTCITSPIDLRIINIYRFFHLLLMRLPDHWIYLQPEMLTRFFHGTFQLVFYQIGPNENGYYSFSQILSSLDPCSNWFSKWLLKCGGSLQDHLLLSLQESHFLEEILVRIAEFQPFTWTFPSSYEKWLYKVLLLIMETKAGRMTVYNVWDQVIEKGERYSSAMANKNNNIQLEKIDEIKLESNVEWNDKLFHRVFPVPIVSNTICNADEEEDKDKDVKDKAATDTHDEKSTSNMTDFFTGIFQVFLVVCRCRFV